MAADDPDEVVILAGVKATNKGLKPRTVRVAIERTM